MAAVVHSPAAVVRPVMCVRPRTRIMPPPKKADAGNDLRAHTQGVGVKPHRIRGVQPHQRRHGGAYAHENVGAHARCPPSGGALRADQPAQHGGQEQPDHGGQEGVVLQHLNELTHGRSSFFRKMAAA